MKVLKESKAGVIVMTECLTDAPGKLVVTTLDGKTELNFRNNKDEVWIIRLDQAETAQVQIVLGGTR